MNPPPNPSPERIDAYPEDFWPVVDDLVAEDDRPVDSIYSEKQQRLLTEPLRSTGHGNALTRPFAAMASDVERATRSMPDLGLGLCLWDGTDERPAARWPRWCDAAGDPIATGAEAAELEHARRPRA